VERLRIPIHWERDSDHVRCGPNRRPIRAVEGARIVLADLSKHDGGVGY